VFSVTAMIRIDFSRQDIRKIKQLRYDDPHPRVRKRMDVLWLKSQGLSNKEICLLTGISSTTLRKGAASRRCAFEEYLVTFCKIRKRRVRHGEGGQEVGERGDG
jgi:hypothetical protein